jgi:dihydrofolate reductase
MSGQDSRVTVHMVASLDGFIARRDGSTDWMHTTGEYPAGETLSAEDVSAFLKTIDAYVMGSRTYETALGFEQAGHGWAYGDTPVHVLTHRSRPRSRDTVSFHAGDLQDLLQQWRQRYRSLWVVGGSEVCGECLRRGLADELRWSILPVLIGDGMAFVPAPGANAALQLREVKAYRTGMVGLHYDVRRMTAAAGAE